MGSSFLHLPHARPFETEHFTSFEPQNQSIGVSELRKNVQSAAL